MDGLDRAAQNVAMRHADKIHAGAKKRRKLKNKKDKFATVMREGYRGTLYSGSGHKVTDPQQMKAMAYSEIRRGKKK